MMFLEAGSSLTRNMLHRGLCRPRANEMRHGIVLLDVIEIS